MSNRRPVLSAARLGRLSAVLALAGIALGTAIIGAVGFGRVVHAVATVGWHGFAVVCAWQMLLFGLLGVCWFVLLPATPVWRLSLVIWGRMVRDAAGQCLPFSILGGFFVGARALTLRGVRWPDAAASTIVDLSAEFVAQIGLVLIGAIILAVRAPHATLLRPVMVGLMGAAVSCGAFVWLQRGVRSPLLAISRHLLGSWSRRAAPHMAMIKARLDAIYRYPGRVALCTVLHLAGWFGTGVASFLAYRLLGGHIDFWSALAIEALLHAVLALAVIVPGYAGVQEVAYAAIGVLFGQPAALSLGVSLLRRARDLALGVPILLVWQGHEWRHRQLALARAAAASGAD